MSLQTRPIDLAKDYPTLASLYSRRFMEAPQAAHLPPVGVIIELGQVPVCAGFVIETNASTAVIGNLISNPALGGETRSAGLNLLISALEAIAVSSGAKVIACSTNIASLGSRFESLGFMPQETGLTIYGKVVI